ncbi:MAG: hypothetical protein H3C29_01725 [Simplicispira suum]|uniref:hypothetical protein n=1 Tax=Simplicispira suum TaxID=2109915 RepID=UPI001C6AD2F4|nr:hypothetical protein [Simplicispira suum]MBW7831909.1 hypothetical protein [Simplicispira suum]
MKKFALAAVAAAAALGAGVAQAYTVGTFQNGVVVPNVIHNGAADTTAVGLINQAATVVPVFWTFFNQNSGHVTDGCFPMTPKDYQPFVWSSMSGLGLEGVRGYLVFAVGLTPAGITTANACAAANSAGINAASNQISANAFQVDTVNKDLAFVPVIDGPLTIAGDLSTMGPASLTAVGGARAVPAGPSVVPMFSMRYYIDGAAGGNDTRIVVWSTGSHAGTHTVNMYDDAQNRKSVNFKLNFAELDWFDPETIAGRPASFVDGFIEWMPVSALPADYVPAGGAGSLFALGGSAFTYSLISAPAFGAVQTVLGAHN